MESLDNSATEKKTGKWRASIFIFVYQFLEKLAFYVVCSNLFHFFNKTLNQTSANGVTNWSGTCYLTPLLGAFLADAYWGNYWAIIVFSAIYVMGMAMLLMCVTFRALKPSCDPTTCQCHPTELQTMMTHISLYMVAIGSRSPHEKSHSMEGVRFYYL
ncbi:protein NRT1/ PTR FAMILY 8.1-like [Humulus lupulus]|uniref:protein NRT1/ PTR FAMILY 8.1-like n=1 Tax=Humulus lupulus TaxID=3486 RepID=UPI002B4092C2|nr:protein NRT1/ PTR FAMILY 8.1-like [Humulus lupulus]